MFAFRFDWIENDVVISCPALTRMFGVVMLRLSERGSGLVRVRNPAMLRRSTVVVSASVAQIFISILASIHYLNLDVVVLVMGYVKPQSSDFANPSTVCMARWGSQRNPSRRNSSRR